VASTAAMKVAAMHAAKISGRRGTRRSEFMAAWAFDMGLMLILSGARCS
jgi:hypothetical protein